MQRHQLKFSKLLAILFVVALCSCAIPKRPRGEVCAIVATTQECACVDSETGDATTIRPIDQSAESCGGYIAVSPQYYLAMEAWIQELITRIRSLPIRKQIALGVKKTHDIVEAAKTNATANEIR